jgi:hypothetical protein
MELADVYTPLISVWSEDLRRLAQRGPYPERDVPPGQRGLVRYGLGKQRGANRPEISGRDRSMGIFQVMEGRRIFEDLTVDENLMAGMS